MQIIATALADLNRPKQRVRGLENLAINQRFTGTINLNLSNEGIVRTFTFTLTDLTGENTQYEVLHNNAPFFIIQAGGPDGELRQQMNALPEGRRLVLPIFVDTIAEACENAQRNVPEDVGQRVELAITKSLLERYGGSMTFHGETKRTYTSQVPEQFRVICNELRSLPPSTTPSAEFMSPMINDMRAQA